MMSALSQSAPRSLVICEFFHKTPASQWHEVPKFLKTMKKELSTDDAFRKYKASLDTVASSNIPDALRKRARKIAANITKEIFEEQHDEYHLSGSKQKAQNSMLIAFYDLIQGAGSKSSTISTNGPKLKRTNSNISVGSILELEEIESDESVSGLCTPPPKTGIKLSTFNMDVLKCLGQQCTWAIKEEDIDIMCAFSSYKKLNDTPFDLSKDQIMDLTSGSTFVASLSDEEHGFVLDELNLMEDTVVIADLDNIFKNGSCFEDIQQWTSKNFLDTPIKRLMLILVDTWSAYYQSKHRILEKQAVAEFLAPVISSSFKQVGMVTLVGEVPVHAVSWRKNYNKDPRLDTMDRSACADIVIISKSGEQVCILESSGVNEVKQEKHVKDHWKIARILRDMWNRKAERLSLTRQVPPTMATFGMQYFGGRLRFYQLDFCGAYRFYEIASVDVPLTKDDFVAMTPQYIKGVMQFAGRIQHDIQMCESSPLLSQREKQERARAIKLMTQTSPTPKSRKIRSGKRE